MSRMPGRPRAVFDCNILIQAVAFENGPSAACLRLWEAGKIDLLISKGTMAELGRVFQYEEVRAMSVRMTALRISAFVQRLEYRATFLRKIKHVMDYPRDPQDEPYLDLAAAGNADFVVTRDSDLLSLMTGRSVLSKEFRQKTHPLRIVGPTDFLELVRQFEV